jgi:hypothetical protein
MWLGPTSISRSDQRMASGSSSRIDLAAREELGGDLRAGNVVAHRLDIHADLAPRSDCV